MKKILSLAIALSVFVGASFAALPSFETAVFPWLSSNGLTKYTVSSDFRPNDKITRGEAAKFVAQYGALKGLEKTYTECGFSDLAGYDATLLPFIQEACAYGLMKGSSGKFNPNDTITEAQAITVVIRSLEGFKNETGSSWYAEYYNRGKALSMIQSETMASVETTTITRAKLGTWFYVASEGGATAATPTVDTTTTEDTSASDQEIMDVIKEIFGEDITL